MEEADFGGHTGDLVRVDVGYPVEDDGGKSDVCSTANEANEGWFVSLEGKDSADICDTRSQCRDGADQCPSRDLPETRILRNPIRVQT